MAKRHHPRRGSMAFSPRKRANRPFGHVKSWPTSDASEVRMQGFAGWKAGMTHVLARDLNPRSTSAGQEIRSPVTVVEVPKMRILGVRGYRMTPYGKQAAGEVWVDAETLTESFPEIFDRVSNRKNHDADKHFENLGKQDLCKYASSLLHNLPTLQGPPLRFLKSWKLDLMVALQAINSPLPKSDSATKFPLPTHSKKEQ